MAHRGRLNVLTNVLGKSPDQIFSEFNGPVDPRKFMGRGDVKYHLGFSSDVTTSSGKRIHLSLAFNPSHLEFVHPVVEGRARAKQEQLAGQDRRKVLPLVIHGDAAMAAQGVVAETLNLSRLRGYDTGGTVHLVINNQLGYTTDPEDGRSSIYCTAVAQMLDIPIFHVNGDDPEACVHAMRLATEYRQRFQSDVVIDLVCFRRYGHNEGDEPSYTQPLMYEAIRHHPPVSELYAKTLAQQGRVSAEEAEAIREEAKRHFLQAYNQAKETPALREPSAYEGLWKGYRGGPEEGIARTRDRRAAEGPGSAARAPRARAARLQPAAADGEDPRATRGDGPGRDSARLVRRREPGLRDACSGPGPTSGSPARTPSAARSATGTRCCTT